MSFVNNNILTYNVNGMGDFSKRRKIFNHLHHLKANIIFLQETHSTKKVEKLWKSEWGGQIFYSHGESNARGVAVLFSNRFCGKIIRTAKDVEGRVIAVAVNINDREYVLASFYAPNQDKPEFFVEAFSLVNSLEVDLQIIAGDFNTVLSLEKDIVGGRASSNSKTRDFVNEYLVDSDLVDIWRHQHPDDFRATFTRSKPVMLMERLDYIFISAALKQNVSSSDILPGFASDHSIPKLIINFVSVKPGKGYWKFNNTLLKDDAFCERVVEAITEVFVNMKDQPIFDRWEMVKLAVREVAMVRGAQLKKSRDNKIQVLERAIYNNTVARDEETEPVFLEKIEDMINGLQTELDDLYSQRTQGAIFRSRANWAEYGEKNSAYFLNLEKHNFNRKTITTICDPVSNELITEPNRILNVLNTYFKKLYSTANSSPLDPDYLGVLSIPQINEKDKYMMDGPIQLEEIHMALKQLKHGKCPGVDGLTPEFYLHFWPYLAKAFKTLFAEIVKNKKLHTSARDGIISLLGKTEKDTLLVPNWRPLTLLNTDYKIFAQVLANRMQQVLPYIIPEDQFGYMKGTSISDNLLDLLSVIQFCEDEGLDALIVSVDYRKAYDSVSWQALEHILHAFNFGETFIDMVFICYKDIRSTVINNNRWSEWFYPEVGLRQGCVLSCYLFLLVTSIINFKISQNENIRGISIGEKIKKTDQYVDDLWNIIRFELSSFQELLHEYSEFEDFTGLAINYDKTEILRIGSIHNTDAKFYSQLPLKWSDGPIKILGIKVHPVFEQTVKQKYGYLV